MSYLLWHDATPSLASPRRLFGAAEVAAISDAQALCAQLAEHGRALEAQASEVRARAREEGFAAGLAEGRALALAATGDAAAALLDAAARERDAAIGAARDDVAMLALQIARKLIGQLPEPDRIARLAQEAARQAMPEGAPLRLRVHPDHEAEVRALLAAAPATASWRVDGDAALPSSACRLSGPRGDADAALDTQLARLAQGWNLPWPPVDRPAVSVAEPMHRVAPSAVPDALHPGSASLAIPSAPQTTTQGSMQSPQTSPLAPEARPARDSALVNAED